MQTQVGFWLDYVPIDFIHTTAAVSEAGLTGPFGCYPQQYWNGTKCVDNPVCPPGQHVQASGSGKPSPNGGVYVDYFCQPDCPPYSYWNAQMGKCVTSAPGSPGGPPLHPCPPGKHYDSYLEMCVGGPKVAGNPQVGVTSRHSGTLKGNPRPPWWGYNYGWPWYGQQSSCYFDPWQGVWVCPASPWVYQPMISTWYYGSAPRWGGGWGGWGHGGHHR